MLGINGKTHIGKRKLNEDRFVADANWGIALVSDGMGGPAAGEVAASIVTAQMVDHLDQGMPLEQAVVQAHNAVKAAPEQGKGSNGMGATLVVAQFQNYDFQIAWVGDSRAYLWNGELRQLTRDHSQVELSLARRDITPEQARHAKNKHLLTRAMGLNDLNPIDVPTLSGTLARGQKILLCSDGLSDVVSGVEIASKLQANASPQDTLNALIERALEAGAADNITAVLVSAGDDAPEPDSVISIAPVSIARSDGYYEHFLNEQGR